MNDFNPDWATPPGETIKDICEERGISFNELADALDLNLCETHDLITGILWLNQTLAYKLENFLGPTAEFWLTREFKYVQKLSHFKKITYE